MRSAAAATIWEVVHDERQQLADDLADLDPERWRTPSLCPGWDVHDVLAHLVDTARTGRRRFVRSMVAARVDFDRANEAGIRRERRTDPSDTLDSFRDVADLTRTPPAPLATRLVEAVVHGEDIRRPLGIARSYPPSAVRRALTHQLRTSTSFGGGRERAAGLRLVDRATGTSWGEGDEVVADALDLLMMISGRDEEVR